MKIDIHITFNDISVKGRSNGFVEKRIGFYDQLVALLKSINLNWDKKILDYEIFVHFSKPLNQIKQKKLRELNAELIYDQNEYGPFYNRLNAYKHNTNGDYSLILDTDIIVFETPKLIFDKEIYMQTQNMHFEKKLWIKWCQTLNASFSEPVHFNNGCILIKNNIKEDLFKYYLDKNVEVLINELFKDKETKHFCAQLIQSILIKKFSWGVLDKKINAYSTNKKNFDGISVLHYLGSKGYTEDVHQIIKKYL